MIPYGKQKIDKADISLVLKSLKKKKISGGDYVYKLEKFSNNYFNINHSISCNSGTSALLLAFLAINVKENDNIILPGVNFIASANICKFLKANIFLADVDPLTGQMSPDNLENCIKFNKIRNIKAVITMYLGGVVKDLDKYNKLKKKYNFYIIEDACHALGSEYSANGKKYRVGSCNHSDICCFSLHPLKTITSGEGGLITTKKKFLYKKMKLLCSHGMSQNMKRHWKYKFSTLGFNFRMSDINAALAVSQFKKISKFVKLRKIVAKKYIKSFSSFKDISTYNYKMIENSSNHLFVISINFQKLKKNKNKLLENLKKNGVMAQFHYTPLNTIGHLKKNIQNNRETFKGISQYKNNSLSIPMYVDLTKNQQNKVIKSIIEFVKKF